MPDLADLSATAGVCGAPTIPRPKFPPAVNRYRR
jgi:hypothetical protein